MEPEKKQEIANLRALNLTPKQIARKLGLRVSEVSAVIRAQAEENALAHGKTATLDPLFECWANGGAVEHFFNTPTPSTTTVEDESQGMAIVTVTRKAGHNRFVICTYLLDYWCLGLKDTLGPRKFSTQDYEYFIDQAYQGFDEPPQKISVDQAQAIVYSVIDYAEGLGFEPHRDFQKSKAHLGEWSGQGKLDCGRDGKPCYFCGPYDDPKKILKTLTASVGEGNFDYVIEGESYR